MEKIATLLTARPDRHLLALVLVALAAAFSFYVLSVAVLAGSMPVGLPMRQLAMATMLAILAVYFCTRMPSAAGLTICVTLLASTIGLSLAMQVGYGIHFLGRNLPLADPMLSHIDRGLGFDTRMLLDWADSHRMIAAWLRESYLRCGDQVLIAMPVLAMTRQNERMLTFVGANFLSLIVVHLVAIVMPAVGTYSFYHITAVDHPHIMLAASNTAAPVFALRGARELVVPADHLMGLVTFPSYHMVAACLFAWLFWPYRWLRLPALAFNIGVAVSALVDGCHYLADIIAGAALAIACVASVRWLVNHIETGATAKLVYQTTIIPDVGLDRAERAARLVEQLELTLANAEPRAVQP